MAERRFQSRTKLERKDIQMDPNKDVLQSKRWPEMNSLNPPQGSKLSDEDLARLTAKRPELILVLREWHGFSRLRAEQQIDRWLLRHSAAHTGA
jgi:hypothetical protein